MVPGRPSPYSQGTFLPWEGWGQRQWVELKSLNEMPSGWGTWCEGDQETDSRVPLTRGGAGCPGWDCGAGWGGRGVEPLRAAQGRAHRAGEVCGAAHLKSVWELRDCSDAGSDSLTCRMCEIQRTILFP